MSIEKKYYETEILWEEDKFHNSIPRFEETATHIPADARTLLDVGCGNGLFLKFLAGMEGRFDHLHGADRSQVALKHAQVANTTASIDALPFPDKSFHIATCLQVIEHLPLTIYSKGLSEICRVAERYVLISVPYEEDLEASFVTCPKCRTQFSFQHHLRSYQNDTMLTLLEPYGFALNKAFYMGAMKRYHFHSSFRRMGYQAKRGSGRDFMVTCPMCEYDIPPETLPTSASEPRKSNLYSKARGVVQKYNPVRAVAKKLLYKDVVHGWIGALYERKSVQ